VVLGSGLVLVWLLNPHIQASMRSDSQIESQNIQQLSIPVCALHASSRSYKVTGLLGIKCMEQVKNGSRITEYLENSPSELNIDVSDQTPSKLQLFFYLHYNSNSKQCMDLKSSVTCL
jgi:vacuolar-type H+-ATPase subunit C/Vma6